MTSLDGTPDCEMQPMTLGARMAAFVGRWDKSTKVAWVLYAALSAAMISLLLPLLDPYHLFAFEPDTETTVLHVIGYLHLIDTGSIGEIPLIRDYPPFFDGIFILYAILTRVVLLLQSWIPGRLLLPTAQSAVIFTIRIVNVSALALSIIPVFATMRMVCRRNILSAMLAVMFILSPPILAMDFLRIDHVMIFCLCWVTYLSLGLTDQKRNYAWFAALGIILGFLVNTKITAPALAIIPALALLWALVTRKCSWRHGVVFITAGGFTAGLLGWRFLMHAPEAVAIWNGKFANHRLWSLYFPVDPVCYYNWEYLYSFGRLFRVLGIAAFLIAAVRRPTRKDGAIVLSAVYLVIFSLMLVPMIKYPRGGYMLLPFYFSVLAIGLDRGWSWLRTRGWGRPMSLGVYLLAFPLMGETAWHLLNNYEQVRVATEKRAESVQITRILPRQWCLAYLPPGTRIGIKRWQQPSGPPIWDLGYRVIDHLIEPPILNPESMRYYMPPAFETLEADCDLFMFDSMSLWQLEKAVDAYSAPSTQDAWHHFFDELNHRYTRINFSSRHANYSVSTIQFYLLNPSVLRQPDAALRDDPLRGFTVTAPDTTGIDHTSHRLFPWIGDVDARNFPTVVHSELGTLHIGEAPSDESLWFYSITLDGWYWTCRESYPMMLRAADSTWLRYQCGTQKPLVFYNMKTMREERVP